MDATKVKRVATASFLVLILSLGALLTLLAAFKVKVFISDDVIYQVLARGIGTRSHPVYIGVDTFIIKSWFYTFIHGYTPLSLYLTSGLLFVGTFILFCILYAKNTRFKLSHISESYLAIPLLWLLGMGYFLGAIIIAPNSRNIEISLGYLILIYAASKLGQPFSILRSCIIIASSCLLTINDPYFAYIFIFPLLLWSLLIAWRVGERYWKDATFMIALSAACLLSAPISKIMFSTFNILVVNNASYTLSALGEIPSRFGLLLTSLANIFGMDFLGHRFLSFISLIGYAGLAAIVVFALVTHKCNNFRIRTLATLLAIQTVVTCGVYVFTTASQGLGTARYLVVVPFALTILVGELLISTSQKLRLAMVCCLVIIIAPNLARSLLIVIPPTSSPATKSIIASPAFNNPIGQPAVDNVGNRENIKVAGIVANSGVRKGYANYWQGAINSYFMPDTLVINIVCEESVVPQYFLVNTSSYHLAADRSFFIVYKNDIGCNNLANRLKPTRTAETRWYRIFFFDYDIGRQLKDYQANH